MLSLENSLSVMEDKAEDFSSSVKAVLLYGANTWRITKDLLNKLQAFCQEVSFVKKDHLGHQMARDDQKRRSLASVQPGASGVGVTAQGLEVSGTHLQETGGDITKRALEWNPQGRRKHGCPVQAWRRTPLAELQAVFSWMAAKKTAQNGNRWRVLVSELCSTGHYEV